MLFVFIQLLHLYNDLHQVDYKSLISINIFVEYSKCNNDHALIFRCTYYSLLLFFRDISLFKTFALLIDRRVTFNALFTAGVTLHRTCKVQ